jgi:hypothetical protein
MAPHRRTFGMHLPIFHDQLHVAVFEAALAI